MKIAEWGPDTWALLHTIAEKIYDDKFNNSKNEIFKIITLIAISVPCPHCRNHASDYLKHNNIHRCNTKHDLKLFIFNFHNNVNSRLGKQPYVFATLSKYNNYNLANLFGQYSIKNKQNRSNDLSFSFHRNINIKIILGLLVKNTQTFSA